MKIKEHIAHALFFMCSLVVILTLFGIFLLLIVKAIPAFQAESLMQFLFTTDWNPDAYGQKSYGILAMLISSLMVTFGSLVLALAIGLGCAAYLTEVASTAMREIIKPITELLAGIPSVVLGFLGIVVIGPAIAYLFGTTHGLNLLNGTILLTVMILPTIISLSEDALRSVPPSHVQASLALGATPWQTLIHVKIPSAFSGIIAASFIAMGRAIGETMAVLMAAGGALAMPTSYLDPGRPLPATIGMELGEVAYGTTHYYFLFALGLVLFLITFGFNIIAEIFLHKHRLLVKK